jgi:hypothetical protein
MISEWEIGEINLDFNLEYGINVGPANIGLVYDQFTSM